MKTVNLFYKPALIALCLALLLYSVALALSGDLDTTFSGDGKIIQGFAGNAQDAIVQVNGKVTVVGKKLFSNGTADFAVTRYNSDGSMDLTFSGDGVQTINFGVSDVAYSVAIQSDGKIVISGITCNLDYTICDLALARLTSTGAMDTTFSGDGKVITNFNAADNGGGDVAVLNGKIVVGGYLKNGASYDGAVYQYNPDGTLDSSFSGDGILPINFGKDDFLGTLIVYSGKIYVAGNQNGGASDFIIARVNPNGTLDPTFSGDGKVQTNLGGDDWARGLAISNGNLVVVGYSGDYIGMAQYTSSGALDSTFSGDGKLVGNFGFPAPGFEDVFIQNGKIVAVGCTSGDNSNGLLMRFTANGSLDSTFGGDGIVTTDWGGNDTYYAAILKNSRIYVAGNSRLPPNRFIVAAYKP